MIVESLNKAKQHGAPRALDLAARPLLAALDCLSCSESPWTPIA